MAIDKKKLAKLAGKPAGAKPNAASRFAKAGAKKAKFDAEDEEEDSEKEEKPKKKGPPGFAKKGAKPSEEEAPEEGEEEIPEEGEEGGEFGSEEEGEIPEDEEGAEDEMGEGNYPVRPGNPGAVIPLLEQYQNEVQLCLDELDYDMFADPELEMGEDDAIIMQEGALLLPPRLQASLENLTAIDYEAAKVVAMHLKNEGKVNDELQLAGWLFRIGQLLEDGIFDEPEEDEEMPEEDEEFEDGEEEEEPEGETGPPF